jgi:hypothetical protein
VKFINDVIDNTILYEKKKKKYVIDKLISLGYPKLSNKIDAIDPPNDRLYTDDDDDDGGTKNNGSENGSDNHDLQKEKGRFISSESQVLNPYSQPISLRIHSTLALL